MWPQCGPHEELKAGILRGIRAHCHCPYLGDKKGQTQGAVYYTVTTKIVQGPGSVDRTVIKLSGETDS